MLVFAGFIVLACQQDRPPARRLGVRDRGGFLLVGILGCLAVLAGWLLYCNAPEMHVQDGLHARLFMPVVPLILVALAPDGRLATRFGNLPIPPAVALLVFYAVWLVGIAGSLH